jgi:uridine kinase
MTERRSRGRILDEVAAAVVALRRPHPVRIGIDGRTAAGKTTLADELLMLIEARGRNVIRACIDDFPRSASEKYVLGRMSPEGYYLHALPMRRS